MKKNFTISLLTCIVALGCKSGKNMTKMETSEPTEVQLTALKINVPGVTMDELKAGRSIFYGACTNCHGTKDVTGYSESELQETIDRMAPKAKLSDTEKDAVWKYALALNLSAHK